MEKYKFENPKHEGHIDTELMNFCIKMKLLAVENGYPCIKDVLNKTLKEFEDMDKTGWYLIQ